MTPLDEAIRAGCITCREGKWHCTADSQCDVDQVIKAALAVLLPPQPREGVIEAMAMALSVVGTNNPNPRKKEVQQAQAPWGEQPAGWRARCEREAAAAYAALRRALGLEGRDE